MSLRVSVQRWRSGGLWPIPIFIQDNRTAGSGLTGLAYNTSGLTAAYYSPGYIAGVQAITLVAGTNGAYVTGGFSEIDATNMPGWYWFCVPTSILYTDTIAAIPVMLRGAANMVDCCIWIETTITDQQTSSKVPVVNALNDQGYTAARSPKLDNLDATISSRNATTPPDTSSIATAVWASATRSLTTFGTLVADVWAYATRTLSAFTFTPNLDAAYDRAKTAASSTELAAVQSHGDGAWATREGTGPYTVTVTVNDGTDPISSASVAITKGAVRYTGTTDASGVVTFNAEAGGWIVAIVAGGYSFSGATLSVAGDTSHTYSMSANAIIPADDPLMTAGLLTCYGVDGAVMSGVAINFELVSVAGSHDNQSMPQTRRQAISDANGHVSITLYRNAAYIARRGTTGKPVSFTTDDAATTDLPVILGYDD